MVMNARKYRRFDDGYADKREAHSFQTSQYPSKNYTYQSGEGGERYEKKRSPNSRNASPSCRNSPRYINKSSYSERLKERQERGQGPSPGKIPNHSIGYPGPSNHSNNGHHNAVSDKSRSQSGRSLSNAKEADMQKSALQTCGDWSEHISSNGKKYYYNIKTEVSQWEKPKEWLSMSGRPERHSVDSRAVNDGALGSKDGRNRNSSGPEKRDKHLGDVRYMVPNSSSKPDKKYLLDKFHASSSKLQEERTGSFAGNRHGHSSDQRLGIGSDQVHRRNDINACHPSSAMDYASGSTSRYRRDSDGPRPINRLRHDRRGHEADGYDDMDISPGSTPTSSRPSSCVGTPQIASGNTPLPPNVSLSGGHVVSASAGTTGLNIASIPGLLTQLSGGQNNQELTQRALDTLHRLQEAIQQQIKAAKSNVEGQTNTQNQSMVNTVSPRQASEDSSVSSHLQLLHHQQHHPHIASSVASGVNVHSHPNQPNLHHHPHHPMHHPPLHSHSHPHPHQQQQLSSSSQQQRSPYLGNNNSHPPHSLPSPHTLQHPHANSTQSVPLVSSVVAPSSYLSSNVAPSSLLTSSSSSSSAITKQPYSSIPTSQVFQHSVYGKVAGSQTRTSTPDINCQQDHDMRGRGSPSSHCGRSDRSSCGSPAPSETSSQGVDVDLDMLSAANSVQKETSLMANLSQYYNEKLVGHSTGWQAEHAERQARRYWEESLSIGGPMCSQVSVELKQARSAVRVKEIHATLREQRNLFLAQQVSELESMKPVSSFLSSS